jgi:hypothetical protein
LSDGGVGKIHFVVWIKFRKRLTKKREATAGCRGKLAERISKWGVGFIDWLDAGVSRHNEVFVNN